MECVVVLILATVWIADSAAYFVGVRFGTHKMTPRLSPKKSWEGYIAGVIAGTASAVVLDASSAIRPIGPQLVEGDLLGVVLSALTTVGDLGESLFKRFAGIKDSGNFLPAMEARLTGSTPSSAGRTWIFLDPLLLCDWKGP